MSQSTARVEVIRYLMLEHFEGFLLAGCVERRKAITRSRRQLLILWLHNPNGWMVGIRKLCTICCRLCWSLLVAVRRLKEVCAGNSLPTESEALLL
jgi:hypothetical protein